MLGPARREMRFMLEASIKAWSVDGAQPRGAVADKVEDLDDLGKQAFRQVVHELRPRMLDDAARKALMDRAPGLYKSLCTHVHFSKGQVEQDLKRFASGEYFGFESLADLTESNTFFRDVLDIALLAQLEAFDEGLVGSL
jgi:hypothetical protein